MTRRRGPRKDVPLVSNTPGLRRDSSRIPNVRHPLPLPLPWDFYLNVNLRQWYDLSQVSVVDDLPLRVRPQHQTRPGVGKYNIRL